MRAVYGPDVFQINLIVFAKMSRPAYYPIIPKSVYESRLSRDVSQRQLRRLLNPEAKAIRWIDHYPEYIRKTKIIYI